MNAGTARLTALLGVLATGLVAQCARKRPPKPTPIQGTWQYDNDRLEELTSVKTAGANHPRNFHSYGKSPADDELRRLRREGAGTTIHIGPTTLRTTQNGKTSLQRYRVIQRHGNTWTLRLSGGTHPIHFKASLDGDRMTLRGPDGATIMVLKRKKQGGAGGG